MTQRWPEVREALDRALDAGDDWEAVVAAVYDEEIVALVRRYMAHDSAAATFLEPPPVQALDRHMAPPPAAPRPPPVPSMTGQRIDERFDIGAKIGEGGTGTVYEAIDTLAGETVAIKFVPHSVGPEMVSEEAAVLRLLAVPGVVKILDDGRVGDLRYLVMERVDGTPFPGGAPRPPYAWRDLARTTTALLETLARVHRHGIVHRDLKPGNILVHPDGHVTILDLGLAWDASRSERASVREALSATPGYAAPEQLAGYPAVAASDLYPIGVMLFEALTAEDPHATMEGSRARRPPTCVANPEVPADVGAWVDGLLEPQASARPPSAIDALAVMPRRKAPPDNRMLPGPGPFDAQALRALFTGPERWFHVPTDGARELFRRTQGERTRVLDELGAWDRAGLARWDAQGVHLDMEALGRLRDGLQVRVQADAHRQAELADLDDLLSDARRAAERLLASGDPGRAWAVLDAAVYTGSGRLPAERVAQVLPYLLKVALASMSERRLQLFRYRLHRVARGSALGRRLDRLAHAATASLQGRTRHALLQLTAPASARSVDERAAHRAIWMYATRRLPREEQEEAIEAAESVIGSDGEDARRQIESARAWAQYEAGRFEEAARLHEAMVTRNESSVAVLQCQANASSAWLEAGAFDRAAQMAGSALERAQRLRNPVFEARLEWIHRAARYRRGDRIQADPSLIPAATALPGNLRAIILLNEAAIAWRSEAYFDGVRLADHAQRAWKHVGREAPEVLAGCLRAACGQRLSRKQLQALADRLATLDDRDCVVQGAALLATIYAERRADLRDLARERIGRSRAVSPDRCREIMSLSDAVK